MGPPTFRDQEEDSEPGRETEKHGLVKEEEQESADSQKTGGIQGFKIERRGPPDKCCSQMACDGVRELPVGSHGMGRRGDHEMSTLGRQMGIKA